MLFDALALPAPYPAASATPEADDPTEQFELSPPKTNTLIFAMVGGAKFAHATATFETVPEDMIGKAVTFVAATTL